MPTTEQYLNQLQTDKSNLVSNLITQGVEASSSETFTSLVPKVLDIKGSEKYNGFLPNNSGIFTTQKGQSSIKITVSADSSSTGTRVYYQKNSYPDYDCSTYIDIENSNSYILNNLEQSTKYYFRCASYVTQNGTKFFNNSKVIGSTSTTYTFIIQNNVYIIASPDNETGTPYLYMSKYTGILYCLINNHFYKLNTSTVEWDLIQDMTSLESKSFKTTQIHITHRGIFFVCDSTNDYNSSYTAWYDENNESFTILNISMRSLYSCIELSNDDILFFGRYSDGGGTSSRQTLYVLKNNNNVLSTIKTNCYNVGVGDLNDGKNIIITTYYWDYGSYTKSYIYNLTTGNYEQSSEIYNLLPYSSSSSSVNTMLKARMFNIGNGIIVLLSSTIRSETYKNTFLSINPPSYGTTLYNTSTGEIKKGPSVKGASFISSDCPICILNDTIYYVDGNLKSWDFESSVGTVVDSTITLTSGIFKYNNKLYMSSNSAIYEFDGTNLVLSKNVSGAGERIFYESSDGLIFANSSQYVLKLNNSTWTSLFTPNTSYTGYCGYLLDDDNNPAGIKVYNGAINSKKLCFIIKDITITNMIMSDSSFFSLYQSIESFNNDYYILYGERDNTLKQILINKSDATYIEGCSLGYNPGGTKHFYNSTDKVLYGLNTTMLTLPEESTINTAGGTNPDIDFTYFRNSSTSAGSQILIVNGPSIQ